MVTSKITTFDPPLNEDEAIGSILESLDPLNAVNPEPSPKQILLGSLGDGRLRVRVPIEVNISTENDDYIAEAEEFSEFGFGKNPTEAINDLRHALVELWFTLNQDRDRLGPDLKSVLDALGKTVEQVA